MSDALRLCPFLRGAFACNGNTVRALHRTEDDLSPVRHSGECDRSQARCAPTPLRNGPQRVSVSAVARLRPLRSTGIEEATQGTGEPLDGSAERYTARARHVDRERARHRRGTDGATRSLRHAPPAGMLERGRRRGKGTDRGRPVAGGHVACAPSCARGAEGRASNGADGRGCSVAPATALGDRGEGGPSTGHADMGRRVESVQPASFLLHQARALGVARLLGQRATRVGGCTPAPSLVGALGTTVSTRLEAT
jgi:hypothetical protein